jgi:hypothetical protein
MGTRSAIAVFYGDKVRAVYCHWDGYVSHNGQILQDHYGYEKALRLVELGDLSSLGAEIGTEHPFSRFDSDLSNDEYDQAYGDMCTFYGRDRKDTRAQGKTFDTAKDMIEHYEAMGAEYIYCHNGDSWFVSDFKDFTVVQELSVAITQAEKETA